MDKTTLTTEFAGKKLTFETGQLAQQATVAILARLGDTVVLATVVEGKVREDLGYFPLSVEYGERLYAGGKIKGSRWVKREGRPSDEAVLIGRLIDRSIRPLFPKEYKNEVQVMVTVLSVDGENQPDILAINAVSAALAASRIPWAGPVGAIRMGAIKDPNTGEYALIHNPTATEGETSDLDIVVSQCNDKTVMIEAGANQVPEEVVHNAIVTAKQETTKMIEFIGELVKKIGQEKVVIEQDTAFKEMAAKIKKQYAKEIEALAETLAKKESGGGETEKLVNAIYDAEKAADATVEIDKKQIAKALEYVMFQTIRENVISKKKRVDGRKIDELRPLGAQVGVLPRTHGSAIFQRGLTQALTITTLGSPRMELLIESAEGEETKRYMHHYAMPPYSVGEAGRVGSVSRREIGHGALAERALVPVIPSQEKFPYTIRLVSEILSSNGSTSMASVCGSTLSLMDAGVPIEKPVAGISVGMMSNDKDYVLLTDIIGLEDFSGDMDFKVAGTDAGITAIQLDVKVPGLTDQQVKETFERARTARMDILDFMLKTLPETRTAVSEFAPKIEQIKIDVEKIGEVIGTGGRTIKGIIASTGATVDVEDDGTVTITATTPESMQKALDTIEGIVREVTPGEEFDGEVKRILQFGAFVEYLPGKEGLVHVSHMAEGFVQKPDDVVQIGDQVHVKVLEIDDQGRVNLTMRMDDQPGEKRGGSGGEDRGGRRDDRGPRRDFGSRDRGPRRQFDDRGPRRGYNEGRSDFQDRPRRAYSEDRGNDMGAQPEQSEHPLSRQFKRERSGSSRPTTGRKPFRR
jgi:polyribonucleotide nucleotidyltransferase